MSDDKIDPKVRAQMSTGRAAPVIILGASQLFEPGGGLTAFAQQHAAADQLELRRQVITQLKRNAETEQARIRSALGDAKPLRSLWIAFAAVRRIRNP